MAKYRLGFAVALAVFILDQLTKWIVTGPLGVNQVGDQLYLLPFFQFTYTENNGISLGLLNATNPVGRWMLVGLASAIAIGGAVWIRTLHGYVTDFLDLHFGEFRPFLIFNVGDAAISIAVVLLLLRAFLTRKEDSKETIEHA